VHLRKPEIELKFELELLYSNQRNFILNSVNAPTWIRSLKGQLTWIFFVWFFCSHRQNFSFWFYITKFLSTLVTWLSCGKQTKFDNPHCWVRHCDVMSEHLLCGMRVTSRWSQCSHF